MENAEIKAGYPINLHDVVIVGAGLTGLRAAIETVNRGLDTAIVFRVRLLRPHSVAAQGGINASLGNALADDSRADLKPASDPPPCEGEVHAA
ncbi:MULTISPECIES: FAD-binding protein [unclassified Methanosarcina]|uniref:FAD-binding protein n=1 Tax=unclassified Methanosarcina TaxID=2644672 RepID=UPI00061610C8|nr:MULTISPECIES: FAD-binding protein [unclassified Methanosarcina]AKB19652.1 hypothetical protein MSWHS_2789 [Methanosarcina sp. WWM596]AKB22557.1 hypothetical protein MSWH1_2286 [Methanosarcina sp. WH1]